MQRKKGGNRTKEVYGSTIRRSEYDDALLRNNTRTGNRLKSDMHFYDRAQKVIMKDLGKESLMLKTKLENDKKTLSLSLCGSKFGSTSPSTKQKKKPGKNLKPLFPTFLHRTNDSLAISNSDAFSDRDTVMSTRTTPGWSQSRSAQFKTPSSLLFPSSRAQRDDFLASILNDPDGDFLADHESHRPDMDSLRKLQTPKTAKSSKSITIPGAQPTTPGLVPTPDM